MKYIVYISLILVSFQSHAQNKNYETTARRLLEKSNDVLTSDSISPLPIINRGILLSQKNKDVVYELKFRNVLGKYVWRASHSDSAEIIFRENLSDSRKIKKLELEADCLNNLGLVKRQRNQLDSSLYYYQKCKRIEERLGNFQGVIETLNNMSVVDYKLGNYPKSIRTLQKVLDLIDKHSLDSTGRMKASVQFQLGVNFFTIDDLNKALYYFQKAYYFFLNANDHKSIVTCIDCIVHTYERLGNLKEIPELLKQLDKSAKESGLKHLLIMAKNARANYEFALGNYKSCKQLALEGIDMTQQYNGTYMLSSLYKNLSNSLYELGHYEEAKFHFLRAIKEAEKVKKTDLIIELNKSLAQCYSKLGNDELAYQYLETSVKLRDSLIPIETKKISQRLEIEYQTDLLKKDNALKDQAVKMERQQKKAAHEKSSRRGWIALLSSLFVLVSIGVVVVVIRKNRQLKIIKAKVESANVLLIEHRERSIRQSERRIKVSTIEKDVKNLNEKRNSTTVALKDVVKITLGKGLIENGVGKTSLRLDVCSGEPVKIAYRSLKKFMNDFQLTDFDFIQVYEGVIINMHHIKQLNKEKGEFKIAIQVLDENAKKYKLTSEVIRLKPKSQDFDNFIKSYTNFQNLYGDLGS